MTMMCSKSQGMPLESTCHPDLNRQYPFLYNELVFRVLFKKAKAVTLHATEALGVEEV
jgi:hypothetical protein